MDAMSSLYTQCAVVIFHELIEPKSAIISGVAEPMNLFIHFLRLLIYELMMTSDSQLIFASISQSIDFTKNHESHII